MSTKRKDYLQIAQLFATKASIHAIAHFHIAFIFGRSKKLLATAINKVGDRSNGAGFSRNTIHAERAVLKAIGDNALLKDAILVVIRVSKTGAIKDSTPCHACQIHCLKAMKRYGLRVVYYS